MPPRAIRGLCSWVWSMSSPSRAREAWQVPPDERQDPKPSYTTDLVIYTNFESGTRDL